MSPYRIGLAAVAVLAVLVWQSANRAAASELHDAVNAGDLALVQTLLSGGANVNELDLFGTPLHGAAARGYVEIARVLIDAGADLEAEVVASQDKSHPLHSAASGGHVAMAALLIERGAKVDSRDSRGYTPLIVAITNGRAETAQLLLNAGADPIAEESTYHDTSLHLAALMNLPEMGKLLLAKGVDINLRSNHNGETPLFYATVERSFEMVAFLLSEGADPNIPDKSGTRPYLRASDKRIRDLLIKHGAK
jgi:ankyrin repeat protein